MTEFLDPVPAEDHEYYRTFENFVLTLHDVNYGPASVAYWIVGSVEI